MAAYKTLTTNDLVVSPLILNKHFKFEGATAFTGSDLQIGRYLGKNVDFDSDQSTTGPTGNTEYQSLVFNQTKQLYYSNYVGETGELKTVSTASFNPDGTVSGEAISPLYDNFLSTTLESERYFPTASDATIGVLSVPQYLYGDYIKPNSFEFTTPSGSYKDDGEGRLTSGSDYIGNVIYKHGIVVLTGGQRTRDYWDEEIDTFVTETNVTCSFSSSNTIFETQYKYTIGESEFNYSQNPSIISGSDGIALDFVTGSFFTPYITTVGLYNDQRDLIAVGKLAQPLPVSKTTDTSVLINIDRH